jgi:hypothetical protein
VGGGRCRRVVPLGVGWGLGEKVMREKRATTFVVARFCDVPVVPPTSLVPFRVCRPSFLPLSESKPPTSLWKGEGRRGCILASEGAAAILNEPTSLNRGEGLAAG